MFKRIVSKDIEIGDKILIPLKNIGEFEATAHKITEDGIMFIFDNCVARMPMYNDLINEHEDFESSDLKSWIDNELLNAFPDWMKSDIKDLSIPTIEENMFDYKIGEYGWVYKCTNDAIYPLMKRHKHRIAKYEGKAIGWWLQNTMHKELLVHSHYVIVNFAIVTQKGDLSISWAHLHQGVRPKFWLMF